MYHVALIKNFYLKFLPNAKIEGAFIKAPCPFCASVGLKKPGLLAAYIFPDSFFMGYFRCSNRCRPSGFPIHFAKLMSIELKHAPGFDPDREPYALDVIYPASNLNGQIDKYMSFLTEVEYNYFRQLGVSVNVIREMKIGYNGRYLVYPYFQDDENCYSARCVLPEKEDDNFWDGDETFYRGEFRIYNVGDIARCENGSIFITEGENNLLVLKELGYPAIAVPSTADLDAIVEARLALINHVFLIFNNTPEAQLAARTFATRLGHKTRILKWHNELKRGYSLCQMAIDQAGNLSKSFAMMLQQAKAFSPFSSPEKEGRRFFDLLQLNRGRNLLGLTSGFKKLDKSINGIRGINIVGGQPKAGKSCFFIQISTEVAKNKTPVIYYDFENGRHNIYTRTLCRISRLSEKEILSKEHTQKQKEKLQQSTRELQQMLAFFKVVTDRRLSPDIMKRHIDFLKHETDQNEILVVVDSLHKLPFKDLSERRTGIDEWLRQMESIRDEYHVAFLVISELSRGQTGRYDETPSLGSFKETGDIEYSADNAMILSPKWNPLEDGLDAERKSVLWLVASRENSPGKVSEYVLEYPYWGFREDVSE
jgi:KaiC/GvpD/RAD55 family RecA-like ATPase